MNKIIKGDVLDVLKTLESDSIDLGITSPPYNKGRKGSKIVPAVVYDKFDDDLPEVVPTKTGWPLLWHSWTFFNIA